MQSTAGSITALVGNEGDVVCPECGGKSIIWHSPQRVPALITQASKMPKAMERWGEFAYATILMTVLPEHAPAFLDRFTLVDTQVQLRERAVREEGSTHLPRYPIANRKVIVGVTDGSPTPETKNVGVTYMRRAGVDGKLEDNVVAQDVDFVVTPEGLIDFTLGDILGTTPVLGRAFAFSYWSNPRYVVTRIPHLHRDQNTMDPIQINEETEFDPDGSSVSDMPIQIEARLEFAGPLPRDVVAL